MSGVKFRRIKGRIIPIFDHPIKRRVIQSGAVAVGGVGGAGMAMKDSGAKTKGPSSGFLALGYGLQVASGVIAGLPSRGIKGVGANVLGSIGADTLSTLSFAKSVSHMKGSQSKKLKAYATHQAIGTGVGYGVFGAMLLKNPAARASVIKWTSKALKVFK